MRIGFISTYPPIECGIATYTHYLNTALRNFENETFVISQFGAQGEGVFPLYQPETSSFAEDVHYTSVRMTPDVIHIQHEYGLYGHQKGVEVLGLILRYRLDGIPVVTTLHTVHDEYDDGEHLLLKYIIEESGAIIVHEDHQKKSLSRHFGPRDNIYVIEHGMRQINPIKNAKDKLNLKNKKIILLCGYFRPSKGFHKIINIFPEICKKDKNVVLVVAGKTRNLAFDDYRRDLFKQLNNSPVVDRIKIFRGQFPQYTFDTIISAADVVVLPYEQGGQSGILAQCYAMNVPVVTSNLLSFRNIINRSGGGLICENDSDYIINIFKIINDNELKKRMKKNIHAYISNKTNWSLIAKKHIEVYHKVVTVPYGKARYIYFPKPD